MPIDLPIIILAAGSASRMRGRDKLMEDVGGVPLLRAQAVKARAVTKGPVIVALPPPPHPRYDALDGLEVLCLPVAAAAEGMSASLRTAFAALPRDAACAMMYLADLPDLTEDDLRKVAEAVDLGSDTLIWRGATEAGAPGHPIVFHRALFDHFATLKGDGGAREVVAAAGNRVTLVPLPGDRARADLDTPEDWARWRRDTSGSQSRT
ncbi:MAG: nucleotidyltransferase family protein [Sulfitobacter sp.]|nr:nucleotidyltransferase family protein [Sulfitobacter sp.]